MKKIVYLLAAFAAGILSSATANAETTECTEITSLPAVITVQGIYCFKQNLVTGITTGNAIEIQTNNVTIDLNGYKLGGSAAGAGTNATGIYANSRKNITLRNGTIRGFYLGTNLDGGASSSGHLLEDLRLDRNYTTGIRVEGRNNIIRNNQILNTGPGDNSSSASGIYMNTASGSLIEGNLVSLVAETGTSYGIILQNSSLTEIRNNKVLLLINATLQYGITTFTSNDIAIIGNSILNPSTTGDRGIYNNSGNNNKCINNIIDGHTIAVSGCDVDLRNDKL